MAVERIWGIDEPLSTFLCLISVILAKAASKQYGKVTPMTTQGMRYPWRGLWIWYSYLWMFTFAIACIYHATRYTFNFGMVDLMNYIYPFITQFFCVYATFLRVFELKSTKSWVLSSIPFLLYFLFFAIESRHFHKRVSLYVLIGSAVLWLVWSTINFNKRKYSRRWFFIAALVGIIVPFIRTDFDVYSHVDSVSIWHLGILPIMYQFNKFLIDDAKSYIKLSVD